MTKVASSFRYFTLKKKPEAIKNRLTPSIYESREIYSGLEACAITTKVMAMAFKMVS